MKKLNLFKFAVIVIILLIAISLNSVFSQIPNNKKYHAGAGVIIGTWGTFACNSCNWSVEKSAIFGLSAATVAGISKELWDKIDYGTFDVKDMQATMIGGVIGTALTYTGLKIFKNKKPVLYMSSVNNKLCYGIKVKF